MSAGGNINSLQVEISNRQILRISLPISFALLIPQVNFITNNIFLGHLGEQELGAAGLTGVYYLIFAAIGFGLNNGLQALISRRAGENRVEEIGRLFTQGMRISFAIAALGVLITYFLAPYILSLSIRSPELLERSVSFLKIRIWGLGFLYVYQMRNALLVGTNQSKYLVAGTLAETLANIFFDYGLIYGKFGMPAIGFNGAAIASVIAEFTGMFIVYAVMRYKGINRRFAMGKHVGFDKKNTWLILQQSSPLIFQHAISVIAWIFFYILVEHHGQRELAISNTMRNIFGFFGVFTWAFAATSNAMVSNVIGQGRKEEVLPLIRKIVRISLSIAIVIALLLNIFPQLFLSVYGQQDTFIDEAIPIVRVVASALIVMSFSTVWLNAVIGTGNSTVNLAIEIVAVVIYSVYVYLVLEVYRLPIVYGWMSEWIYWLVLFSLSYAYLRSGKWKKKVI